MPICSFGGATCFAGPAEEVKAHESEVHGRQIRGPGGNNRPAWATIPRLPPKSDIDKVEEARIQRWMKRQR